MTHPPSVDLPPMPEGSTFKITFKEAAQVGQTVTTPMHYTADNMRAYAQLAVNEALERAAKKADDFHDPERSSTEWEKGYNSAAKSLAAAIRSLKAG